MMHLFRTLLIIFSILLISACGGSGGNAGDDPEPTPPTDSEDENEEEGDDDQQEDDTAQQRTGKFVDSAVAGISYSTSPGGLSGTTDAEGRFDFEEGDTVTFSIGDLTFPATRARGIVTPLTMADTDNVSDTVATNIARLLQSLDFDGNASNGLQIPQGAAEAATAVDFSANDFDEQVVNLVANSGSSNTELVSAEQARAHLAGTLLETRGSIAGSWYYIDQSAQNVEDQFVIILTLTADGSFALLTDEDQPQTDGFELGEYQWDVNTGAFTISNVSDYNGDIGLAGSECGVEDSLFTIDLAAGETTAQDRLLLGADTGVGEGCDAEGDGAEVIEFQRLYSDTDGLVGTWVIAEGDGVVMVHLLSNGLYAMLQEGAQDGAGQTGIERGQYEVNSATSVATFSQDTDTNGEWGLSHPCPGGEAGALDCHPAGGDIEQTLEFDASANQLVYTNPLEAENGDGPVRFDRLGPTGVDVQAPADDTLDISGTWSLDTEQDRTQCDNDGLVTETVATYTITQDGTSLTVTDSNDISYEGTLDGGIVTWSGSDDGNDPGWVGETHYTTTAAVYPSSDGLTMTGSSAWTYTETTPSFSCSGVTTFSGSRN